MIPDAFQVLDDHQQIQCGIHIGRAGCDLLRQHLLDLVKVCVHCVICRNDLLRGGLVLSGQRCQSVQDHLVSLAAHFQRTAYRRVPRLTHTEQVGQDLGDIRCVVCHALQIGDRFQRSRDAAPATGC